MSDWADFCQLFNIDPNDPKQFEDLLRRLHEDEPELVKEDWLLGHRHIFRKLSHPNCSRCDGTGYLGKFKHVSSGRCFRCIPDGRWHKHLMAHAREGAHSLTY